MTILEITYKLLQRKKELESKMVKSSKEIEEYMEIVNYFKKCLKQRKK